MIQLKNFLTILMLNIFIVTCYSCIQDTSEEFSTFTCNIISETVGNSTLYIRHLENLPLNDAEVMEVMEVIRHLKTTYGEIHLPDPIEAQVKSHCEECIQSGKSSTIESLINHAYKLYQFFARKQDPNIKNLITYFKLEENGLCLNSLAISDDNQSFVFRVLPQYSSDHEYDPHYFTVAIYKNENTITIRFVS